MGEELTVPASVPACSACVHVVYAAPAACPSEAAFADMVADDGGHATLAAEDDAPTAFHVHIEGSGPFTGRLVVRRDDGTEATRTIPGATCDDVARSLAVLVALATPDGPTPALAPAPAPTLAPAPKPPRPTRPPPITSRRPPHPAPGISPSPAAPRSTRPSVPASSPGSLRTSSGSRARLASSGPQCASASRSR